MKLTSIVSLGVLASVAYGLDSAGDLHDDSVAWQTNLKATIARFADEVVDHGYLSRSNGYRKILPEYKVRKYLSDLQSYMIHTLNYPVAKYFDACAGSKNAYAMEFQDYVNCRLKVQRMYQTYPAINPLLNADQLRKLKTKVIKSRFQTQINHEEFMQMESMVFLLIGSAVFEISDSNSDFKVQLFSGARGQEGYQMVTELARMYRIPFKEVINVSEGCTGVGDIVKLILILAKLEWNHVQNKLLNENASLKMPSKIDQEWQERLDARKAWEEKQQRIKQQQQQAQQYNYRNRQNYNNNNYNNQGSYNNNNYRYNNNRYYNKKSAMDSINEKCGNFRDKSISPEEKKNRLMCFFNQQRHGNK